MEKMNMNGGFLSNLVNKWVLGSCVLLMTLSTAGSASADFDPCCDQVCDCEMNNFSAYVDFLYWQVNPESTEFARYNGISSGATTAATAGQVLNVGCDFYPGFRIGALLDLGCCDWDAFAQYTFLIERRTKSQALEPKVNGIAPLIFNQGGMGDINLAKGDWHSNMNVVDFGLGKTFNVHCCYSFRPHFGLKATWQDYKYDVTYDRSQTTTIKSRDRILMHSEFDGIGLRGGFDAEWLFSPCTSFAGGMSFSTLYSDYNTDRSDLNMTVTSDVEGVATKNLELKERFCALIPVLELYAGVKFTQDLNDCYNAFVFVGYEAQVWYDALRFIKVQNVSSGVNNYTFTQGNLTFSGLVLRAGVSY